MNIHSSNDAVNLLKQSWLLIVEESRSVLGSELHYQAMVYHCLRQSGLPREQVGMNVKMWIDKPVSPLFKVLDQKKHPDFQGGFEPIPDVCIFSSAVNANWRRRNYEQTLKSLLLAIEIKASERQCGRLRYKEIADDIKKLAAHRMEAQHRGGDFEAVMLIIDTAPLPDERMTEISLTKVQVEAQQEGISFLYLSPNFEINTL